MVPHLAPLELEARGFLETLFPDLAVGEYIKLRLKSPSHGSMRREFFANPQEALRFAAKQKDSHDGYLGVAPRRGRVETKDGVVRVQAIWANLDAKVAYTRETCFEQFTNLLGPSVLVWTGGGFHVYWLLEESVECHKKRPRPTAADGIPCPMVPIRG